MRSTLGTLAVALVAASVLAIVPPVAAHNPANTVYEPAAFHEGVLVLGEEGTAALVTMDGRTRWQANLSGQVTQPPTVDGDAAATVIRSIPNVTPRVQAFDAQGPAWTVELAGENEDGFVTATGDGFLVASTDGRLLNISRDGAIREDAMLPFGVETEPVRAPGGGWVLAGDEGKIAIRQPDGTLAHETRLGGQPRDLARAGDLVLAAFDRGERTPAVKAYDAELSTQWVADFNGLRVGGELAVGQDRIYLGTYRSSGARAYALSMEGQELWDHAFKPATAAAVTAGEAGPYVTINNALIALEPTGHVRWQVSGNPRLVGPSLVGDFVFPSGADNKLAALHASNGTLAWTWDDGVTEVPWTDEGLARRGGSGSNGPAGGSDAPAPLAAVLAGLAAAAILGRRR